MNWRSKGGKSGLIKMLMEEHKLSKRKAEKAVNAVFERMTAALKRGEEVELPVGWLRVDSRPAGRKAAVSKTSGTSQMAKHFSGWSGIQSGSSATGRNRS